MHLFIKINTSFENDYGITTHQTPVRDFQAEDRGVAATLKSENSNSAIASLRDKMLALKDVDGSSMFSDAEMNFIRENYTTQDIQRLDRVIDKLSELYSDVEFPDVDVRNSFTSIITNPYFKSTKDFQFVEDVLNFKSDPETLYDAMYEDIFLNLSEDNMGRFYRRMCGRGQEFTAFSKVKPQRSLDSFKRELIFLAQISARHRAGEIVWNEAYIGLKDAIIAPLNQERGWTNLALNIVKLDAPHYSAQFFNENLA